MEELEIDMIRTNVEQALILLRDYKERDPNDSKAENLLLSLENQLLMIQDRLDEIEEE